VTPTALRSFEQDIALLDDVLSDVCRAGGGAEILQLRDQAVELAALARGGDGAAGDRLEEVIAGLDLERMDLLIRSLTRWFQLVNLAEDNERVRRLRAREAREGPMARQGQLQSAVQCLASGGSSGAEVAEQLRDAEVRLVMTAHPTEARRRTTIDKQARIFRELRVMDETLGQDEPAVRDRIRATVQELWGSDDLRAVSLGVLDEVRGGLVHFSSTLTEVTPLVYRDLERALAQQFPGEQLRVPPLLRFGSWIGGDRDGNPLVTASTTLSALGLLREHCLRFLDGQIELIAGRLSLSDRLCGPAPLLAPILSRGEAMFPTLAQRLHALNPEEPYRRALSFVRERLRETVTNADRSGYRDPGELLEDLRRVERALRADAGGYTAASGDLHDVIRQVEVFGFHFVTLDIRQHANVHRGALAEVFSALEIADDYERLDENHRTRLLTRCIDDPRPLIPGDLSRFSEQTRETIETFRAVADALRGPHPGAIDAYVISGAETAADALEVLLLMKESGLAETGGTDAKLRVVPLFESGAALRAGAEIMGALLEIPVYRRALAAVGDEQEVMVGYSDSNKDVGFLASGWLTYRAQQEIAAVLEHHGLRWRFFHGRGGAVGRGGGRTADAIIALPPGSVAGRLKMTEQGEVLNAKYTVSEIAHRELELTLGAVLTASSSPQATDDSDQTLSVHKTVMDEMVEVSESLYREVVHEDPDLIKLFYMATPVDEVSRLRLGSRPARRGGAAGIGDLRAIPWVFSWTQSRIILPAWLGLGSGLRHARQRHGVEILRAMLAEWPFFQALLANAEMACAKADMGIARRYVGLWADAAARDRLWGRLEAEFELTREELLTVRGGRRLLDSEPVLQAMIDRRNPSVDPLSFIQVELLRRRRESPEGRDSRELERLGLLVINGIASGLRNTG
jgi:phosphoenolpyruvate carboxylase